MPLLTSLPAGVYIGATTGRRSARNYIERNRPKERQITMERRIKWSDKCKRATIYSIQERSDELQKSDKLQKERRFTKERQITKGATNYIFATEASLHRASLVISGRIDAPKYAELIWDENTSTEPRGWARQAESEEWTGALLEDDRGELTRLLPSGVESGSENKMVNPISLC